MCEAVEQLDPAQQVEEAYKKVHDGQWGWRALRLLAKKSPYFFTYGNAPIGTLPKYLTTMLKKHYPEWDKSKAKEEAGEAEEGKAAVTPTGLTEDHLAKLAKNLGDGWPKLAPKLGQTKADIEAFQKEEAEDDEAKRGLLMLKKWVKEEGEGATKDEIQYILEGLKMESVLEGVF